MKQKINVTWQEMNSGGEQIDLHHAEERNDSYRKKLVNVASALKQHHPDGCSQVSQKGFSATSAESPKIFLALTGALLVIVCYYCITFAGKPFFY